MFCGIHIQAVWRIFQKKYAEEGEAKQRLAKIYFFIGVS
jgi:hypothetical protein